MNIKSILLIILLIITVLAWFRDVIYFINTWRKFAQTKGFVEGWFGAGFQAMIDKKHLLYFSQFLLLVFITFLIGKYFPNR